MVWHLHDGDGVVVIKREWQLHACDGVVDDTSMRETYSGGDGGHNACEEGGIVV